MLANTYKDMNGNKGSMSIKSIGSLSNLELSSSLSNKQPSIPTFTENILYVRSIPQTATLEDLRAMFKTTHPRSIRYPSNATSLVGCILEFNTPRETERAFATMNNTYMKAHKGLMGLTFFDPNSGRTEIEPPCQTIMIKHVAPEADDVSLYSMFREIGHIYLCKLGMDENGTFRGFGLIQYWNVEDTNAAYERLSAAEYKGCTISLTQYVPREKKSGKTPSSSIRMGSMSGSIRGRPGLNADLFKPPTPSLSSSDSMEFANYFSNMSVSQQSDSSASSPSSQMEYRDPMAAMAAGLDPCNLHIKNLDPSIMSSDLFYEFRHFGNIMSARVMMNETTLKSKGFGFVSFRSVEDASKALAEMNGRVIRSKPIVVCIAEPRNIREARPAATFGVASSTSGKIEESDGGFSNGNGLTLNPALLASFSTQTRNEILGTRLTTQLRYLPSISEHEISKISEVILKMKIDDIILLLSFPNALEEKALEIRTSLGSGAFEEDPQTPSLETEKQQLNDLISAIQRERASDITELLLGLPKSERAKLLQNPDYLASKVNEAKKAFGMTDSQPRSATTSPTQKFPLSPEAEKLVSHLDTKPEAERKQEIGTKLFPLVKGLGVSDARKLTVRLLDSVGTRELVYLVNEPAKLRMGKGKRANLEFLKNSPITEENINPSKELLTPPLLKEPVNSPFVPTTNATSAAQQPAESGNEDLENVPLFILISTYFGYIVLIMFGHIRDFFGKRFKSAEYAPFNFQNGFAPVLSDFESFYRRRLYRRISDCFNRPITGVPGRTLTLIERVSHDFNRTFKYTGQTRTLLNLSSYNYLGFAQSEGACANAVEESIRKYGISLASSRMEVGTTQLHQEAEAEVARFVGKEDSIIISMGFATNSTTLPCLVSKGSLIISDEFNHSSIVSGARLSGAAIKIFKHNNMESLEQVLRESISQGQPRTHRPWKKIVVIVEGLYSMEGNIVRLPEIIQLKKKYKFYLYVDEAHSIGALGSRGRGVCDFWGIDPSEVDILMGTFTKSFGAAGGYIAADKSLIDYLRLKCHASVYAEPMSVPVLQQVITSMKIIMGEDGTDDGKRRLQTLAFNSRYFATKLREKGFIVYGHEESPVVPLMLFNPAKIPAFSRECLKRGIAVVVVAYPATPIVSGRVRFCLSSAHTKEDLDWALEQIDEIGDRMLLKVNKNHA
ncbi:PLP-dependent transferase [Basidiobolus meristosporus CBS 931.73]|uniref:serine C-palmitoyltransferase n=1 Tax=Basidiobolus meristosporus CBS 931.73 TaxID=1314790 RepID=A0A1Y1Z7R3_9FUNG|nr:PLP-dependent transferase [Basidiobolus meristosporus CBS 931.73]|eukprot:ORY06312.1 PLP-dependent transferase [Basidiobolus meristosporus CBS 931.73]